MRFLGVEQVVTADGQRYKLSRLSLFVLRRWLDWATDYLGPVVRHSDLPAIRQLSTDAIQVIEDVAAIWHTIHNPHVMDLYYSPLGREQMLALLLEKYHWREDPEPIVAAIADDAERLIERAAGVSVPTESEAEAAFYKRLRKKEATEEESPDDPDWQEQFRGTFANLNLPPHVLGEMTLPEFAMVHRAKMSDDEIMWVASSWKKLTEQQRKDMSVYRIETLLR